MDFFRAKVMLEADVFCGVDSERAEMAQLRALAKARGVFNIKDSAKNLKPALALLAKLIPQALQSI
eukprot:4538412-Alexandrium_andersonii.AAC.1